MSASSGAISGDARIDDPLGDELAAIVSEGANATARLDDAGGCYRGEGDPNDDPALAGKRSGSVYVDTVAETAWIKLPSAWAPLAFDL